MFVSDFIIPLNREDLLQCSSNDHFWVREEFDVKVIEERLESARTELNEEGINFIVDHFSTFFSLIQKFKQCSQLTREKGLKIIRKCFNLLSRNIQILLDDVQSMDSEVQQKMCNLTKMILYLVIELVKMFENQMTEKSSKPFDNKSRKKQTKVVNDSWDWTNEKHSLLLEIDTFLQFPLKLLWEPPVVDEDFVNLIANFCYKCLEDPSISSANSKKLKETIFQILGILINSYLHGLSFCVKIVQLLKTNDHMVSILASGVILLVQICNCKNIVKEIVREVADTDGDQLAVDTSGTRNLNLFLVQLAESIPEAIIPAIDLLIYHLNGDSYSMRICVVGVLGEIVLNVLTRETLDENHKKMRDDYLDCLEEHIHDVNAFVRTKVLQIWQKLCLGKAIPISRVNRLLDLTIGRLNDKSTNVKKQAVHLIKDLLEGNPFCGQLNISEIQSHLEQEKQKLELFKNPNAVKDQIEWNKIETNLRDLLKNIDEDKECSLTEDESVSVENMIDAIGSYLESEEYKKAISATLKLKSEFYKVYDIEKETCSTDTLIYLLHKIFKQKKSSLLSFSPEIQDEIEKHNVTIEYLENALEFSKLINFALPIILTFLDSNVVTDVLEAVHFFSAAYLFGFQQALEGVRKMLYLVFSKEANIKLAISNTYKELYFQKNGNERQKSIDTIKNLSELILKLNFSQLDALEEVVKEWVKADIIDKNFVQVLFERFSKKIPGTTNAERWAAMVLIKMVGAQEPKIIRSNVSVLLNEGLKNLGSKNFLIAKEICKAFRYLLPPKEQGKYFDHTLRYRRDHEIPRVIYNILKIGIWKTNDFYYIPMADEAVNLIFDICEQPDKFFKNLIVDIHDDIIKGKLPEGSKSLSSGKVLHCQSYEDFIIDSEKDDLIGPKKSEDLFSDLQTTENFDELYLVLITRFISILGQVACNYVKYLEGPVLNELKLRNQLEYEKKLKKFDENKKFNISSRKNLLGANDSGGDRTLSDTGKEDLEFNRVAADDMDTEDMKKKTENEIVTGHGFLAKFTPLILEICKNPGKYNNKALQNAALITLSKFMQVSSVFCEENLQLLVTVCEKSLIPERQQNGIIALGALQYRFPNSLEPWTPHMYAMLQNSNSFVRYYSILVITDLIVNEMIKVRSHISNLALCIVDKDIKIARVARHFFREYSQKGNSLYNVLPSLISNLTQSHTTLSPEEFKVVMKYILTLVTKEKQFENLVEKLCQYFESATTKRQWCDLAYCLSLLSYGDKSLKKIIDNIKCFASKLYLADVYEAFCTIISDAGKNVQKDRILVNELQTIIKEYRDKTCDDKGVSFNKKKQQIGKKKVFKKKYLPSDSEEDELELEEDVEEELEELDSKTPHRQKLMNNENKGVSKNLVLSDGSFVKETTGKKIEDLAKSDNDKNKKGKVKNKENLQKATKRILFYKNSSEEEENEFKTRSSARISKKKRI